MHKTQCHVCVETIKPIGALIGKAGGTKPTLLEMGIGTAYPWLKHPNRPAAAENELSGARTRNPANIVQMLSMLFLTLVAVLLVLPLAQTIKPIFRHLVAPLEERRQPGPFPSPQLLLRANGDFATALNGWFDDRVGFRDLFIRTKNQIDYSLFGTSRKVYVGKDGWLFDRGAEDSLELLNPTQLTAAEKSFTNLAKILVKRGIRLVVVGYPDKSRVYSEMAPLELPKIPTGGNDDKLRNYLATQPSLTYIDAQTLLTQQKISTGEHVYLQTDMHATEVGEVPVVKEIISRIAQLENRTDVHWDENLKQLMYEKGFIGSEARFLAPLIPITEKNYPWYQGSYTIGAVEPDGDWTIPDPRVLKMADEGVGRAFDWEFRTHPQLCQQRLPGMVLFGNSFSDLYWALGLHRYFCFIRRVRNPIGRFKLFYDTIPEGTKYFIYEFIFPWLPTDLPPVDEQGNVK